MAMTFIVLLSHGQVLCWSAQLHEAACTVVALPLLRIFLETMK
jgi:hypothetical protein